MKTLTPKQQRLVEENQKLVYEVAKRYIGHHDFENIQASGFLGLCQAAARFDPKRGFRFSTYAWKCIAREVNKASDRELLRDEYTVRLPESDVLRHEVVSAHTASAVEALLAERRENNSPAIVEKGTHLLAHSAPRSFCVSLCQLHTP